MERVREREKKIDGEREEAHSSVRDRCREREREKKTDRQTYIGSEDERG